jgi:hypothetical protein
MQPIVTYLAIGVLLKKPSESTPVYDVVKVVLSHRHHLIIHVGVGSIQLVNGSNQLFTMDEIQYRI